MSNWIHCPNCGFAYDMYDHPDYWYDGCSSFQFTCYECPDKNVKFQVEVEHNPKFTVLEHTMKEIRE